MTITPAAPVRPVSHGSAVHRVAVLMCGHTFGTGRDVLPDDLPGRLASDEWTVRVVAVDDLCERPSQIQKAIRRDGDERLVVGLCGGAGRTQIQTYARRAGFDTFALQIVGIYPVALDEPGCKPADSLLRLRAAVARASAFPGALPENSRAALAHPGQAVSRRELFTLPPVRYRVAPTIDADLCASSAGCDLCSVACPARAIARGDSGFSVDRGMCTACGQCLEVCPEGAVRMPGSSPGEIAAEVEALLVESDRRAVCLAFYCRETEPGLLRGWLPVAVTCVNSLPVSVLLQALAHGARAVSLVECVTPCDGASSTTAAIRVDFCRNLLRSLGEQQDRAALIDRSAPRSPSDLAGLRVMTRKAEQKPGSGTHGKGSAAPAIRQLAEAIGNDDSGLEHPASPLGLVSIDSDACTVCGTCAVACVFDALREEDADDRVAITFDPNLCSGCGRCVESCPEQSAGAIKLTRAFELASLKSGRRTLVEAGAVKCSRCRQSVGSSRLLERVRALLGDDYVSSPGDRLCASCRNLAWNPR